MNYFQVFQISASYLRMNKLGWRYIWWSLGWTLFSSLPINKNDFTLNCFRLVVWFIIVIVLTIYQAALVNDIFQKHSRNVDVPYRDSWTLAKSKIIRIFGLYLILLIPIILVYVLTWLIFHRIVITMSFIDLLMRLLISPISAFGVCAIMINESKILAAAWTGLLITCNKLLGVIFLGGIFILVQNLLLLLLILIFSTLSFGLDISFPLSYLAYRELLRIPTIGFSYQALLTILFPWYLSVFTLAYLNFTKATYYPASGQRQSAV
jgi:hypothetical protein